MGGENTAALSLPLMKVFEDAFPYYLKIGMTYDQYWFGDVSAHKAYRKAEKLRLKGMNTAAWLQGMYFYEALMDAAPAIKAFCKSKPRAYPSEPYDFDEEERKMREEAEQKERYERMREKVADFAKKFNERQKDLKTEEITPYRKEENDIDVNKD